MSALSAASLAQTYPQLINQLSEQGWSFEDLRFIKKVHNEAMRWYDSCYRAQGVPLLNHTVRTASILARDNVSPAGCAAGLLHAVYLFGIFDDGHRGKASPAHRKEVSFRVGQELEARVFHYCQTPWRQPGALEQHAEKLASYSPELKEILALRLANELEDRLDGALAYRGGSKLQEAKEAFMPRYVALSKQLGLAFITQQLDELLNRGPAFCPPDELKSSMAEGYHLTPRMSVWAFLSRKMRRRC